MSRALKTVAVLALLAVLPLRAVAAVTIGFCASGHKDMAVHADPVGHGPEVAGHASHAAHEGKQPFSASCGICAEHCSSAAFAPSAAAAVSAPPSGNDATFFAERSAPAFVPEQPDPPPLA